MYAGDVNLVGKARRFCCYMIDLSNRLRFDQLQHIHMDPIGVRGRSS